MRKLSRTTPLMALALLTACATAPKTTEKRDELQDQADTTLSTAKTRDVEIGRVVEEAAGYAVFPEVGQGGALVGGAHGRGILYQKGEPVGYVELNQAEVGALLGGQTYSEIVVFQTPTALAKVKRGQYAVGADASAVVLTPGAAASKDFTKDVQVFVIPRGGLMANLSVSGQKINYEPMAS